MGEFRQLILCPGTEGHRWWTDASLSLFVFLAVSSPPFHRTSPLPTTSLQIIMPSAPPALSFDFFKRVLVCCYSPSIAWITASKSWHILLQAKYPDGHWNDVVCTLFSNCPMSHYKRMKQYCCVSQSQARYSQGSQYISWLWFPWHEGHWRMMAFSVTKCLLAFIIPAEHEM